MFPSYATPRGRPTLAMLLLVGLVSAACSSGSSGPTAPGSGSGGSGVGPSCRTYPTATTAATNPFNAASNVTMEGTFNSSSRQLTVSTTFLDGSACSTIVSTYQSVADFVDEVSVIPPVSRLTSQTTTSSGTCGNGTSSITYTYDAQRRLTQVNSPAGTITFNVWDMFGRPTAGTLSTGGVLTNAYDNAARTQTETQVVRGQTTTNIITYDANGAIVLINNFTSGTSTTITVLSTATVCR
jgi:YD repeat-containing protein